MTRRPAVAAACAALALAGLLPLVTAAQPDEGWRDFQATWSASGRRHALAVEGGGTAAIIDLSGAVVVTGGQGLGRGFRGEVIGFDDGQGMSVARAVWTDEQGDRLYSRLTGEATAGGRRITATITGGTGRYDGIEGEYAFTWQYVLAAGDDRVQGRAADIAGRVRRAGTGR